MLFISTEQVTIVSVVRIGTCGCGIWIGKEKRLVDCVCNVRVSVALVPYTWIILRE